MPTLPGAARVEGVNACLNSSSGNVDDASCMGDQSSGSELYRLCSRVHSDAGNWESVRRWLSEKPGVLQPELFVKNALCKDNNDRTALHLACMKGAPPDVVISILDMAPETAEWVDDRGRTPLHLVFIRSENPSSPEIAKILLEQQAACAQTVDGTGKLAISILVEKAFKEGPSTSIMKCSDCYMHVMSARVDENLFKTIQSFPYWLKAHAVMNRQVQNRLDQEVSKKFPTMIIVMDFFTHISTIASLMFLSLMESESGLSLMESESGLFTIELHILFHASGYWFVRRVVKIITLFSSIGRSNKIDSFDVMGIVVDAIIIGLLFFITINLAQGKEKESLNVVMALTIAIVNLWMMQFLTNVYVDFSVFMGGVYQVARRCVACFIALGIILHIFASIFLVVYRDSLVCVDSEIGESAYAFCMYGRSYLRLFTMLVGEVQESDFQERGPGAVFLYITYLFTVVVLLANILAYIIGSGVVDTQRSKFLFWLNRLHFAEGVIGVASLCDCLVPRFLEEISVKTDDNFREAWKHMISLVVAKKGLNWKCATTGLLYAFFVIPSWLVLGLLTCGILWPPQVREYLLCQATNDGSCFCGDPSADALATMKEEINSAKAETRNLEIKLEEINSAKEEIRNLEIKLDKLLGLLQEKGK